MRTHLHTYLNDHLAGSVGALELLDHLVASSTDEAWRTFFVELRAEIAAEQAILQKLVDDLGAHESALRQTGAWVLEKLSHLKLQLGVCGDGLGLLQALESLAVGITGKRSLWRLLGATASTLPDLQGLATQRSSFSPRSSLSGWRRKRVSLLPRSSVRPEPPGGVVKNPQTSLCRSFPNLRAWIMALATENPLEREFRYFLENLPELVAKYGGKVAVIKNERVIGVFDDELSAINETKKEHVPGTFLVQRVEPGEESYTQTFHSRVKSPRESSRLTPACLSGWISSEWEISR